MEITKKDFSCTRGEWTIRGEIMLPESEPTGVIILSHGFGGSMYDMVRPAEMLVRRSFMAVCCDFVGGSRTKLSGGRLSDMTVLSEVEDLKAVINHVKSLPECRNLPLYLMGGSQGGLVTALTAAEIHGQVKIEAIILEFPALCIPDDARRGNMVGYRFNPDNVPDLIEPGDGREQMSGALPREVMDMDVYREISRYRGKVLLLHGDMDGLVKIHYSEMAEKAYSEAGCDCMFVTLHGAGHGFNPAEEEFADEVIAQFLAGYRPFLTAYIELGETVDEGDKTYISFGGTVEGNGIRYEIKRAKDVQTKSDGKVVSSIADYTAVGSYSDGHDAFVRIVNMFDGVKWKPWMVLSNIDRTSEGTLHDCTEAVEWLEKGPVVHLFTK